MTLQEQFERYRNEMRPCEPYLEDENLEQWIRVLAWQEHYTDWLEAKLQNTSPNSDYAKCPECGCKYGSHELNCNHPSCVNT